nr:MAG TPA: hypothetical protein [Caudoviricetes sp.]
MNDIQPRTKKGGNNLKIFDNIDKETKKSIKDTLISALIDLLVGIILLAIDRLF